MSSYFWYASGVLTGVAAAFIIVPLMRALTRRPRAYVFSLCAAVVVAIASAALIAYRTLGRPDALDRVLSAAIPAHSGARVHAAPGDVNAWSQLATLYRRERNFGEAQAAYRTLIELDAMSADSWADYADVLATLAGGSLAGEPASAIDRALAIDARHPKALWLRASLAYEQQRYRDSLALWKKLREALPAGSPDIPIVDANIVESAMLAGQPAPLAASLPTPPRVEVTGTVRVDQSLAARVAPGATLYILAKAADSPGPPLAVLRTSPAAWPVSFTLDDTLAMLPARKLSDFSRVIVEARLSRSGQVKPATGDLYAQSPVLAPGDGKKLELVIARVIG